MRKGTPWKTRFKQWTWIFNRHKPQTLVQLAEGWCCGPTKPKSKTRWWFKMVQTSNNDYQLISIPTWPCRNFSIVTSFFPYMIPCDLAVFQISASRTACSFRPQLPKAWAIEAIGWKFMRHDARDGTKKMGQEWIGLGDIIDISSTHKWSSHQEWQQTWLRWELSFTLYNF